MKLDRQIQGLLEMDPLEVEHRQGKHNLSVDDWNQRLDLFREALSTGLILPAKKVILRMDCGYHPDCGKNKDSCYAKIRRTWGELRDSEEWGHQCVDFTHSDPWQDKDPRAIRFTRLDTNLYRGWPRG